VLNGLKKNATHDVSVNTDKPGHYIVKHKEKESILNIKIFVNDDAKVNQWYVKTNKPGYEQPYGCRFGPISVISSPQGMIDNKKETLDSAHGSIRRSEDQLLNLKCIIEPEENSPSTSVRWEFSQDGHTYGYLPTGIDVHNNEIQFDSVQKFHRGYYRCTLNDISFTILLRVKDRLAALWPFIGILSIVLVLVIIIIIFERRQKSNTKSVPADDDEQDQANDALIRSAARSSDNDNKKRAVKA